MDFLDDKKSLSIRGYAVGMAWSIDVIALKDDVRISPCQNV